MHRTLKTTSAILVACGAASASHAGLLLGTYELTGGSLAVTDADAGDGITISDLNINSFPASILNGDGDGDGAVDGNAIRIDGTTTGNGTSSAFAAGQYFSITVTNNSGSTLDFESIGLDYKGNNIFQNFAARIFTTTTPGSVVDDTIGRVGKGSGGTDDAFVTDIGLLDGTDPAAGANFVGVQTSVADGDSITFHLPFNMNSNSTSRFMDIDNITISAVPEPTSAVLGLMLLFGASLRRRAAE